MEARSTVGGVHGGSIPPPGLAPKGQQDNQKGPEGATTERVEMTYQASTAKRTATMAARMGCRLVPITPAARKAPAAPKVPTVINGESLADFTARLATMPKAAKATKGQMAKVNRKRSAAKMRQYKSLRDFRADFPTMRSAAIEYRILSA